MLIIQLSNGNFAVMESKANKNYFMCECESYSAAEEMRDKLEGKEK